MNVTLYQVLSWFQNSIVFCYPVIVILFFAWLVSSAQWKKELVNFLFVINTLVLISFATAIIFIGTEWYRAYSSASQYEWFSFPGVLNQKTYLTIYLVIHLIAILFAFKKLKISWMFSMIFILLLRWEMIYLWLLQSFFRDYSPSSWSVSYPFNWPEKLTYVFLFVAEVVIMYAILYIRNKLPHDSILVRKNRGAADVQ